MTEQDLDRQALQDFLLDIDCLEELLPWTGRFNIFDVLKAARSEIRHSNILAWLLDANENHGLGDRVLRAVLQKLVRKDDRKRYDVFRLLTLDYYSFSVYREWKNIDLLLVSEEEKLLIAIENKVGSHEHSNQLNRYRELLTREFRGYGQVLVFLTPEGEAPSDTENWDTFTYAEMVTILETVTSQTKQQLDVQLLIQNYIAVVRRDIVEDQRLIEICNKIYNKHRRALDLIYAHRIDGAGQVLETIRSVLTEISATGEILFEEPGSAATYLRFYTPAMDKLLPLLDSNSSAYGTNRMYSYYIYSRKGTVFGSFELSGKGGTEWHADIAQRIIDFYKPDDQNRDNFKYKRLYRTKSCSIEEGDFDEEELRKAVAGFVKDLLNMEQQLMERL